MTDISKRRIGEYTLLRLLGKGSFGEVYLAEHMHRTEQVAIKILYNRLETRNIKDFLTEARNIRLDHPHILRIKDFDVDGDHAFLVMNYCPGGNMRKRHPRGERLSWDTVASYVRQIANALQYIHDQGLVHRDVKPENILFGLHNTLLLSDFGTVTTSYTINPHAMQHPVGTAHYIAPEQIQAKAVRESDQYSLGAIMYEWLTGEPLFFGTREEVLNKHISTLPEPLRKKVPSLSVEAEKMVMQMLAKDPGKRFASMRELLMALDRIEVAPAPDSGKEIILTGHQDGIRTLAWSPDGKYIASGGRDNTVHVWEATMHKSVFAYHKHADEVWSVTWSPDSRYIASAGSDKTVQVWEATTGYAIHARYSSRIATYIDHTGIIRAVCWSPDSKLIASTGDDHLVQIWEATTGMPVFTYSMHTDSVYALAWFPNGRYIASAGSDMSIHIWSAASGTYRSYRAHDDRVTALAWSPDGTCLASASDDYTIRVWNATTWQLQGSYKGHQDSVTSIAWTRDNKYLISGSWDSTVKVWDIHTCACISTYRGHKGWVNAVTVSPNGSFFASGSWDRAIHLSRLPRH